MRTRPLRAGLVCGLALAAALPPAAGVTSTDATTILVRGDAGPSSMDITTSSGAPGGRLVIGNPQTNDRVVATDAAGNTTTLTRTLRLR